MVFAFQISTPWEERWKLHRPVLMISGRPRGSNTWRKNWRVWSLKHLMPPSGTTVLKLSKPSWHWLMSKTSSGYSLTSKNRSWAPYQICLLHWIVVLSTIYLTAPKLLKIQPFCHLPLGIRAFCVSAVFCSDAVRRPLKGKFLIDLWLYFPSGFVDCILTDEFVKFENLK